MCVDVGCRAEIAVPQPLLNLFERHMVRKQQARAAVPQVMKANMPQMVLLKRQLKHRCYPDWIQQIPLLIDADIAFIVLAIAAAAKSAVLRLPNLQIIRFSDENAQRCEVNFCILANANGMQRSSATLNGMSGRQNQKGTSRWRRRIQKSYSADTSGLALQAAASGGLTSFLWYRGR